MILEDTFLFFARYPEHSGVMKNFNKKSQAERYLSFKSAAQALNIKSTYPEITDYVFGVSDEAVKKRISTIQGLYLFVDYGNIRTTENSYKVKKDSFDLSLTIAKPFSSNAGFDSIEELIEIDRALELLALIKTNISENREDPYVKKLTLPTEIIPFASKELSNSFGFSMVFQLEGIEMI
ncbi:MAG: hypothetical protein BGO30_08160 [Bacteroidetes bacterium 41-46]|jgi:hypothetical protein|nr:MAG: hypothetical protein BGO30_08160 [Bacteroidetes bacterium 41-46]